MATWLNQYAELHDFDFRNICLHLWAVQCSIIKMLFTYNFLFIFLFIFLLIFLLYFQTNSLHSLQPLSQICTQWNVLYNLWLDFVLNTTVSPACSMDLRPSYCYKNACPNILEILLISLLWWMSSFEDAYVLPSFILSFELS